MTFHIRSPFLVTTATAIYTNIFSVCKFVGHRVKINISLTFTCPSISATYVSDTLSRYATQAHDEQFLLAVHIVEKINMMQTQTSLKGL